MPHEIFENQLKRGRLAEGKIATWLRRRGNSILPIYEVDIGHGKGPQFYTRNLSLVAPDLLVIGKRVIWIEAKCKTVFTWHRMTKRWTTGIDLHHYEDYKQVRDHSGWPVWLLFNHESSTPDQRDIKFGCPLQCPIGLFGRDLHYLESNENHRHGNWGNHGMVYWAVDNLYRLADSPPA